MAEWVSLREASRRLGVNLSAVQKAIASGRISEASVKRANGRLVKIEIERARAEWAANTDPVEAAKSHAPITAAPAASDDAPTSELELASPAPVAAAPAPKDDDATGYLAERAKREKFAAAQAELTYLKEIGLLVAVADVRAAAFKRYRTLRDQLRNIPDRIAAQLAAERDPAAVHAALMREIDQALNDFARDARLETAGGVGELVAAG